MLKQFNNLLRSQELQAAADIYTELNILYRGDFFEFDPFFEEADQKRGQLRESFKKSIIIYTRQIPGADRREELIRRALELDSLDETLWQIYLQSLQEQGKQAQAHKQYQRLEKLLLKELSTTPDEATRAILD